MTKKDVLHFLLYGAAGFAVVLGSLVYDGTKIQGSVQNLTTSVIHSDSAVVEEVVTPEVEKVERGVARATGVARIAFEEEILEPVPRVSGPEVDFYFSRYEDVTALTESVTIVPNLEIVSFVQLTNKTNNSDTFRLNYGISDDGWKCAFEDLEAGKKVKEINLKPGKSAEIMLRCEGEGKEPGDVFLRVNAFGDEMGDVGTLTKIVGLQAPEAFRILAPSGLAIDGGERAFSDGDQVTFKAQFVSEGGFTPGEYRVLVEVSETTDFEDVIWRGVEKQDLELNGADVIVIEKISDLKLEDGEYYVRMRVNFSGIIGEFAVMDQKLVIDNGHRGLYCSSETNACFYPDGDFVCRETCEAETSLCAPDDPWCLEAGEGAPNLNHWCINGEAEYGVDEVKCLPFIGEQELEKETELLSDVKFYQYRKALELFDSDDDFVELVSKIERLREMQEHYQGFTRELMRQEIERTAEMIEEQIDLRKDLLRELAVLAIGDYLDLDVSAYDDVDADKVARVIADDLAVDSAFINGDVTLADFVSLEVFGDRMFENSFAANLEGQIKLLLDPVLYELTFEIDRLREEISVAGLRETLKSLEKLTDGEEEEVVDATKIVRGVKELRLAMKVESVKRADEKDLRAVSEELLSEDLCHENAIVAVEVLKDLRDAILANEKLKDQIESLELILDADCEA